MQSRRYFQPAKVENDAEADDKSDKKYPIKPKKNKEKPMKTKKKKRLIVRNLSFQVTPDELRDTFSKFGKVVDVNIPLKEGKRKRGFAFVEFEDFKSLIQAMKAMNNKEIHGRRVAIDYAVDKTNYQLKLQNIKKEKEDLPKEIKLEDQSDEDFVEEKPDLSLIEDDVDEIDDNEKRANEFLKEFDSGFEAEQNENDDTSDESSDDSEEEIKEEEEDDGDDYSDEGDDDENNSVIGDKNRSKDPNKSSHKDRLSNNKKISHDVSEGKTVFLRNVSFATTKESLKDAMTKYGECVYCLICIDPFTDHSKGTGFVKFKNKESADKLIQDSLNEPGILIDGRKLMCSPAVSKEAISQQNDNLKKPKDKRNLRLLKVGLIMSNSDESEGVSPSDMAKRSQLEMLKNRKLKNVNFFVSDTRLMIHNLPKTMTDANLKKLLKDAAGKGAVVTEARVMKEFKKINAQGIPLSKGFGFVSFSKHEDALKALMALNNNPNTFTKQKRPIVEFSVENKVALLTKERRREKIKQRNKTRSEDKHNRKPEQNTKSKVETLSDAKVSSKKNKKRKKKPSNRSVVKEQSGNSNNLGESPRKKHKKNEDATAQFTKAHYKSTGNSLTPEKSSKKKQKKNNKRKSQNRGSPRKAENFNQESFHNMVNKFKEKLLDKI